MILSLRVIEKETKQAGAELCQAQEKLHLAKASNKLRSSSSLKDIEFVFHEPFDKFRLSFIYVKLEVVFHLC